ncbi:MAG: isoprenylcysteine carboxylmethyltransferase family protein [Cyclobacteriaceae bacterium]|nr:isoprenylcysteine carboxylmethyltransferase family protein [Cyclobacteriaceae bacterium]
MNQYLILIAGWIIYFFIHSLLASDRIKEYFTSLLGKLSAYYRLLYNVLATGGLLFLLFLNASIPSSYILQPTTWTRYFSLMLATVGIFILKAAFKQYSLGEFLGFRMDERESFKTEGILVYIRHPLYSATVLITIGFWLFIPDVTTLISVGCIFLYLAIGIPLEERKLIKRFGDAYREYRNNVPSFIPKLKRKG